MMRMFLSRVFQGCFAATLTWADFVRQLDRTHPTTIGVVNHAHIPRVFETGRCLSWAGVKLVGYFVDSLSGQRVAEQKTSFECDFRERESQLFLLDNEF